MTLEPQIANALPMPVLVVDSAQQLVFVNPAAEQFFGSGAGLLLKHKLEDLIPFGSPLPGLIAQARARGASVGERTLDLSTPRNGERLADVTVTPVGGDAVLITLQERSLAQRIDRQLLYRGAVRSMHGMAAVRAHEIKNPLAGIRGAAQLIEETVDDKTLTRLICDETDRIRTLIDRMESFGDTRSFVRKAVNIHEVLGRVRKLAEAGFARDVVIRESFDPSLPDVAGDFDQLVQVFLNLVRNAADALPEIGGEVTLTTGYRPGVRFGAARPSERVGLPIEVTVRDNGAGVSPELMPHIFDPFVTTKTNGTGLGLALVAKIIGDHGGIVECDSAPAKTIFRILLPKA